MSLLAINLDGGMTDAGQSLAPFGSIFTQSGVLRPNAFTVTELSSPGMGVEVSGSDDDDIAIIKTPDGATYYVKNTMPEQVTILANTSGVTKTDAIVLYVDLVGGDGENAGSPGAAHLIAVRRDGLSTGLPTNGEIDAAAFNNPWILLKEVTVEHGAGEIEDEDLGGAPDRAYVDVGLLAPQSIDTPQLADESVGNQQLMTGAGEPGGEWQNYSSQSITGWSSTTNKELWGKLVGKTFFYKLYISGTSNSTAATITMPYQSSANGTISISELPRTTNNGTATTSGGYMYLDANSSTLNLRPTHDPSSNWTNTGNKIVIGSGSYDIN